MEQRFSAYGDQIVVIAIDPDAEDYTQLAEVAAFCQDLALTIPVGIEETSNYELLTNSFEGANPYPVDVVVDKQGVIRYVAREYDPDRLVEVVEQLLAE
jgi:hypothetical protein